MSGSLRHHELDTAEDLEQLTEQAPGAGKSSSSNLVKSSAKTCAVCQKRVFSGRKKLNINVEKNDITTCSDACKRKLIIQKKSSNEPSNASTKTLNRSASDGCKALTRSDTGSTCATVTKLLDTKVCSLCGNSVHLAYRCKYLKHQTEWYFVCRPCWRQASGTTELASEDNNKLKGEKSLKRADSKDSSKSLKRADSKDSSKTGVTCTKKKSALKKSQSDSSLFKDLKKQVAFADTAPNPYYIYGGTWKSGVGMTNEELARSEEELKELQNAEAGLSLSAFQKNF